MATPLPGRGLCCSGLSQAWGLAKAMLPGSEKVKLPVWVKVMPQVLALAQGRLRSSYWLSRTRPVRASAREWQRQKHKIQSQQSARGARRPSYTGGLDE